MDGLTLTDFNITYHDSFASAQDGTIGIIDETVQYNSAGNETIYIRVEDAADATCYTIRSFTLTVLPTDDSTISYNTNAYCLSEMNPLPDNIVTLGGIFTISNGGTIDSATGELDLTASALGTDNTGIFTITYTTTGTCFSSTDFIITLTNDANATFVYPINACLTGTNPIPTSITNTGGTFTVDNGAMIDAVTGELDLSSTTEGQSYIITHTFTGICPGQETQTIMIIGDDDSSFTYPLAIYCNDGTNPLPTATTSGGLYSISNGGIIDNTTGEVNLSGSALGTDNSGNFTVTYTTTGDCPTSSTFNLTIEITNDASFTLENQVCISGSNPSPLTIATVGGIFTVDNGATIDSATGELDLTSTTAGTTYAITYTFGGNCPSNSSQSISVIGDDDSSFTYPMNIYCNDGTDPIATATVVTNAGTYAINNGGVINIANGEIDLDASALGTDNSGNFTITYTTTGDCPTSSTFNITIELTKDPSFDFANEICLADPNPSASNIASTGGTFSVDNGASINATTGELDLSTTMEGTVYTVTYTFTGNCPSDTSNTITIIEVPSISAPTTTLTSCDNGNGSANFDISIVEDEILGMTTGVDVTYHPTSLDANNATNEMSTNPELVAFGNIWIRVENSNGCFSTVEIPLIIEQCFLVIPQGFSPNSDITENQTFSINHLRTKYPDFKLYVYNRFGNEVFYGSASKDDWNGEKDNDGEELPAGTYFYGLELNDDLKTYHKGWVYLQR